MCGQLRSLVAEGQPPARMRARAPYSHMVEDLRRLLTAEPRSGPLDLSRVRLLCADIREGVRGVLGRASPAPGHQRGREYTYGYRTIDAAEYKEYDLQPSVTESFFLHIFFEKNIQDESGNTKTKVMKNFKAMLHAAGTPTGLSEVTFGLNLLSGTNGYPQSRYGSVYGKWATDILSNKTPFIFPSGFSSSSGGHMVTVHFRAGENSASGEQVWIITFANSGLGINKWHNELDNKYRLIYSHEVTENVAKECLAALLQNQWPYDEWKEPRFPSNKNIDEFYEGAIVKSEVSNGKLLPNQYIPPTPVEHITSRLPSWAGVFDHPMVQGEGDKAGSLFMSPQITGSCTFHSMMWMLFYLCGGDVERARTLESALRNATLANLDLDSNILNSQVRRWSGEEISCIRLLVKGYGIEGPYQTHPVLNRLRLTMFQQAPPPPEPIALDLIPKIEVRHFPSGSLDPLTLAGKEAASIRQATSWSNDLPEKLENMATQLSLGLGYVIERAPAYDFGSLPCGTSYVSVVLNLARAMAIGCVEHLISLGEKNDQSFGDAPQIHPLIRNLASAALYLFTLFEGGVMSSAEPPVSYFGHTYLDRYRAAIPRLLGLAVLINEASPYGTPYRLTPPANVTTKILESWYLDNCRAFQFVRSKRVALRIRPYLPYAFISGNTESLECLKYWNDSSQSTRTYSVFHFDGKIDDLKNPLKSFIQFAKSNPTGSAMAALVTLLHVDAQKNVPIKFGGSPHFWYGQNENLHLSLGGGTFINPFTTLPTADISPDPKGVQAIHRAMDDIVQIASGAPLGRVIHNDVHLASAIRLGAETWRTGFGTNDSVVVDRWRRLNYSAIGTDDWDAYQRSVFENISVSLAHQIATMPLRALAYLVTKLWSLYKYNSERSNGSTTLLGAFTARAQAASVQQDVEWRNIRVACLLGAWFLSPRPSSPIQEEVQMLRAYLQENQGTLAYFGESPVPWKDLCKNIRHPIGSPLPVFVLCRLILEWAACHSDIWLQWILDIVPPLQRLPMTVTSPRILFPTYILPSWFQLPFPHISPKEDIPVELDGVHYDINAQQVSRRTDGARLVFGLDFCDDLGILVSRLNGGGFGCTVWHFQIEPSLTLVEFSDRLDQARRGSVRCHRQIPWELVWEGRTWELVHDHDVPAAVREWGWGYKGGAVAFWVRDASSQDPPTFLPRLLLVTSHHMTLTARDTAFNRVGDPNHRMATPLPVRTMLFTMQPCGLVPYLTADPDDYLLLFALCDFSAKDRCVARMYWSIRALVRWICEGIIPSMDPRSALAKYVNENLCRHPEQLGHPYKFILQVTYPFQRLSHDDDVYVELGKRSWSADLFVPPTSLDETSPPGQSWDSGLVADRLTLEESTQEWKLVTRSGPGPDTEAQVTDTLGTLRADWARIHRRSYLDSLCTRLGQDHHRSIWNTRVLEAHWATRGIIDDPRAVAMVASRVHPAIVRLISEERSLLEWQFEAARGMFLNRAQIEELEKVWPKFQDPQSPPPPARIFQAVMGMGKSAVLIPFLVFRSLQVDDIKCVVVVQPDHLVRESRTTLHNFFAVLGGFYGPELTQKVRIGGVLEYDKTMDRYSATKHVHVVSDTHLKEYFLKTLGSVSDTKPIVVKGVLDYAHTMIIYDEIDSMYTPLRSEYNIPVPDSRCFHPCQGDAKEAWKTAYGQFVVASVNNVPLGADQKTDLDAPILPVELQKKIRSDVGLLRNQALNFHFGHANDERVMLAVPYKAVRTPMDSSAFSDIDVTAILTYRTKQKEGLLARDIRLLKGRLAEWRRDISCGQDGLNAIFRAVAGPHVPAVEVMFGSADADLAADPQVGRNPALIDYYVVYILFPRCLSFFRRRSNISFVDVMDISQFKLGFSGTVSMTVPLFPTFRHVRSNQDRATRRKDMSTQPFDPSISGSASTEVAIRAAIEGGSGDIPTILPHQAQTGICGLLQQFGNLDVVIDAAAVWKDESADSVFELVRPVMEARHGGSPWTFVYIDDQDRPRERGDTDIRRQGPRGPDPLYRHPRPGARTLYYFDQRHSRGTDLILPNSSRAVVTVDPSISSLSDIAQAAFRLRWINRGQTAHYYLISKGTDIDTGNSLYDRLGAREEEVGLQQRARHDVQNYKAVRRWGKLRRGPSATADKWDRPTFDSVFTEVNPYPLLSAVEKGRGLHQVPENLTSSATATPYASSVVAVGDVDDIGALLKKLQEDILTSTSPPNLGHGLDPGTEQNLNAEAENESETQRQKETGAWGKTGNCLPSFMADIDHTVSSYSLQNPLPAEGSLLRDALSTLGIVLSPLLFPPTREPGAVEEDIVDPPPRIFRNDSLHITILSLSEYLATPMGTGETWRSSVYDRYGSRVCMNSKLILVDTAFQEDPKIILARLLCGAHLDIGEQLLLLQGYCTSEDTLRALFTVISCLQRNQFFHLTRGHLLDHFMNIDVNDVSMGTVQAVMEKLPTEASPFVDYLLQADKSILPMEVRAKLAEEATIQGLFTRVVHIRTIFKKGRGGDDSVLL